MVKIWLLMCMTLALSSGSAKAEIPTPQEAQARWLAGYKREHSKDLAKLLEAVEEGSRLFPQSFCVDVSHIDPDVVKQVSNDLRAKGWIVSVDNVPLDRQVMHVTSPLKEETK